MFRLLTVLCASLFLTMLIGGRDHGQQRFGLADAPARDTKPLRQASVEAEPQTERRIPLTKSRENTETVIAAAQTTFQATTQPVTAEATLISFSNDTQTAPTPAVEAEEAAPELPMRYVNTRALNLREGPSTSYAVIGNLARNEAVTVVEEAAGGWVRIRIEGDGGEGFVAARLLTDKEPN